MKRCLICQVEKPYKDFLKKNPVCKECVKALHENYDVDYIPPEKVTKLEGYLRLIKAIRDMAEEDEELEDWEAYWMHSPEWKRVWLMLGESERISRTNGGFDASILV